MAVAVAALSQRQVQGQKYPGDNFADWCLSDGRLLLLGCHTLRRSWQTGLGSRLLLLSIVKLYMALPYNMTLKQLLAKHGFRQQQQPWTLWAQHDVRLFYACISAQQLMHV